MCRSRSIYDVVRATVANATGDHRLHCSTRATRSTLRGPLGTEAHAIKFAYVEAVEAGIALGDREASGWFLSTWRDGARAR